MNLPRVTSSNPFGFLWKPTYHNNGRSSYKFQMVSIEKKYFNLEFWIKFFLFTNIWYQTCSTEDYPQKRKLQLYLDNKVNSEIHTWSMWEIYSKLPTKSPKQHQWLHTGIFIIKLEQFHALLWCFHCWLGKSIQAVKACFIKNWHSFVFSTSLNSTR